MYIMYGVPMLFQLKKIVSKAFFLLLSPLKTFYYEVSFDLVPLLFTHIEYLLYVGRGHHHRHRLRLLLRLLPIILLLILREHLPP